MSSRAAIACPHGVSRCPTCDVIAEVAATPRQRAWKRLVSEMGRKGGKASAAALTPAQRTARARNAVAARWSKRAEAASGAREGRAKP